MKKKKKKPLLLWLVGAALAFALIICALVFGPGLRRVDRNTYYGAEEGRVSLLLNTEILPENGLCMDDEYYLPLSMVCERLNSRFYYDQETAQIRYALPEQLLTFSPEEAGYYLDGEWVSEEKPLLILREG